MFLSSKPKGDTKLRGTNPLAESPGKAIASRNRAPRMVRNPAVRDSMAAQTQTHSWREMQCRRHRLVLLCQSRSRYGRGRRVHRQEWRHVPSDAGLAKSRSARADGFGRTARAMAALRRRREIWISCFPSALNDFADICCPFRVEAMSAAYCSVRVTAGFGRPSAVQTRGR